MGGRHFSVRVAVLTSEPDSVLGAIFANDSWRQLETDADGRIVLTATDPASFAHLLEWLRSGQLPPLHHAEARAMLRQEAEHFNVSRLVKALSAETVPREDEAQPKETKRKTMHERYITLSDGQFVRLLNKKKPQVSGADMRRFSLCGMSLSDARFFKCDLSGVDLRWAFLNNASLVECDLRGADLRGTNHI